MSTESVPAELLELREKIDQLDQELVILLAERFALTRKVGEIKARACLGSFDPEREQLKIEAIRKLSEERQLNPDLVTGILADIMREVVSNHEDIRQWTTRQDAGS